MKEFINQGLSLGSVSGPGNFGNAHVVTTK